MTTSTHAPAKKPDPRKTKTEAVPVKAVPADPKAPKTPKNDTSCGGCG
jgi:hypothetical protein